MAVKRSFGASGHVVDFEHKGDPHRLHVDEKKSEDGGHRWELEHKGKLLAMGKTSPEHGLGRVSLGTAHPSLLKAANQAHHESGLHDILHHGGEPHGGESVHRIQFEGVSNHEALNKHAKAVNDAGGRVVGRHVDSGTGDAHLDVATHKPDDFAHEFGHSESAEDTVHMHQDGNDGATHFQMPRPKEAPASSASAGRVRAMRKFAGEREAANGEKGDAAPTAPDHSKASLEELTKKLDELLRAGKGPSAAQTSGGEEYKQITAELGRRKIHSFDQLERAHVAPLKARVKQLRKFISELGPKGGKYHVGGSGKKVYERE